MIRAVMFLAVALASAMPVFAQVPPGDPYDPAKHPNPIVTYVGINDFKRSGFTVAQEAAGIELIGLSQTEGKRESVDLADASLRKAKILGRTIEVTFYPAVRQKFQLRDGGAFVIYSFRNPKSGVPAFILDEAAFTKTKKPAEARFGTTPPPEKLQIRGSPALLFEKDGEITVFWQENGACHTATASVSRKELFRLIEDLL